jgi:hypothetical protein
MFQADATIRKALEGGAEALPNKPVDFLALRDEIDSRVGMAARLPFALSD